MVKERLEKHNINLNITSVISDFELNIIKGIDDMLGVDVEGCFFHFSKALQTKVEKSHFKTRYEKDLSFQYFIKECGALAHCPLNDIEEGLRIIEAKYNFDDDEGQEFKAYFIKYIRDFWINGVFPPQIWNCWARSQDLTNNAQEGYNSRTNKTIKQVHPSPGILLCHIRNEIKLSEQTVREARIGIEKPRAQPLYRKLAERRLKIKKIYQDEKKKGVANLSEFLSNIGHNAMSSISCGRTDELKKTTRARASLVTGEDGHGHDVSTWIPVGQNDLSVLEQPSHCYNNRRIAVTKRTQEKEQHPLRFVGKKCPSCGKGFNKLSTFNECHSCDSLTHKRSGCLELCNDGQTFLCKKCNSVENPQNKEPQPAPKTTMTSFNCKHCQYKSKSKFNWQRHVAAKHSEEVVDTVSNINTDTHKVKPSLNPDISDNETNTMCSIQELLESIHMSKYTSIFQKENIDLGVLNDLSSEEFMNMCQDIGVNAWGDRYKIKKAVENLKLSNKENLIKDVGYHQNQTSQKEVEILPLDPEPQVEVETSFIDFTSEIQTLSR